MLAEIIEFLACPVCGEELAAPEGTLVCANRHSFDIARRGYVNLLTGSEKPGTADTAEMLRARAAFLAAGHFETLARAVAHAASSVDVGIAGCVVDAGAGTGYYLAGVLDALPERRGVALDISKEAAKLAARAHERAGAAVADTWKGLPILSQRAAVILDVFAPRNFPEFSRVLADGGLLVVATPRDGHLAELVEALDLVTVDARKSERLAQGADGIFSQVDVTDVESTLRLSRADVATLVSMGPSARHAADDLEARVHALREPFETALSATVRTYRIT